MAFRYLQFEAPFERERWEEHWRRAMDEERKKAEEPAWSPEMVEAFQQIVMEASRPSPDNAFITTLVEEFAQMAFELGCYCGADAVGSEGREQSTSQEEQCSAIPVRQSSRPTQ